MANRKDVLFLCQFFYPQRISSAVLPFETARELASRGLSVDALVGGADVHAPKRETVDSVGITRLCYFHPKRGGLAGKLIGYLSFAIAALGSVRKIGRYRSVVVYTNPPVLPLAALLAKRRFGTKLIFVVYDVYPEIAVAVGAASPRGLLARCMNRLNRALYSEADCVIALTDEMRAYLLAHRPQLSAERIVTIENWATEAPQRAQQETERSEEMKVSYVGNIGPCQEFDTLLQAAELLREDSRIRFCIAGDGSKASALVQKIRRRNLPNVTFLGKPSEADLRDVLCKTDCAVIGLQKGMVGLCAPSKYYNHLRFGHPILAVAERESQMCREIRAADIGRCTAPDDGEALRNAIVELAENAELRAQMRSRAKALYRDNDPYTRAMDRYFTVVSALLS